VFVHDKAAPFARAIRAAKRRVKLHGVGLHAVRTLAPFRTPRRSGRGSRAVGVRCPEALDSGGLGENTFAMVRDVGPPPPGHRSDKISSELEMKDKLE
jgi:hypothetical protein